MASRADDGRIDGPTEACSSCRYFEPIGRVQNLQAGECRLRAPFVVGTPEFRRDISDEAVWYATRWPVVSSVQWCGNHTVKGKR